MAQAADLRETARGDPLFGLDTRFVDPTTRERPILIGLFLLIFVAYGALGRDVFYNHSEVADAGTNDPIGAVLPFVRVLVCAAAAFVVVMSAGLTWAVSKVPMLFAPFCALAVASTLWSSDPKSAFQSGLILTAMWIASPMVIHRLGIVQVVRSSLFLLAMVVIVSALLAILVPSIGTHSGLELGGGLSHAGRWRGIFAHKNGLGPWSAYASVFLFTHAWLCGGPRLFWWFARCCALACLFLSGSVTSLALALFVLVLWAGFQLLRRVRASLVFLAALLAVSVAGVAFYGLQDVIFDLVGRDATLTGRTGIWEIAFEFIGERPWFGYGFASLGGADFLDRVEILFAQAIPGPESGYLTILIELGIVGMIFFFVPFVAVIRNGVEWLKHLEREDRAALEFQLIILLSTLLIAATETNSLVCTGFDGPIAYTAFFALLTTPRSPDSRMRREFRLAHHATPATATGAMRST